MFIDRVKVNFQAGKGGDGHVSFDDMHKPSGGNGGEGGSIFLEGDNHLFDLKTIKRDYTYRAEDGERGAKKSLTGRNGKDTIIHVPIATHLFDNEGNLIFSITKHGERQQVVKGGRGGYGNEYFKRGQVDTLYTFTKGKPGYLIEGKLVLELISDVIFIGLPNAGKSSILNQLSKADVKTAAYAFTTLYPQLGRMDDITLMDLPGLIERTFEGKGVGTEFVKHTKSSRLVAHFLSLESDDIVADYKLIRNELKSLSEELYNKKEIIVLTKTDLKDEKEIKAEVKKISKFNKNVVSVSIIDDNAIAEVKDKIKAELKNN